MRNWQQKRSGMFIYAQIRSHDFTDKDFCELGHEGFNLKKNGSPEKKFVKHRPRECLTVTAAVVIMGCPGGAGLTGDLQELPGGLAVAADGVLEGRPQRGPAQLHQVKGPAERHHRHQVLHCDVTCTRSTGSKVKPWN